MVMRNPSRHRATPNHLLVQATACFMALLLWTGAGGHLVAESLPGTSGADQAPVATLLQGAQCDSTTLPLGSSDSEGHSPAECIVCQILDAPTSLVAPPSAVVPISAVDEGSVASEGRTCRPSFLRIRTRAPPQV